jgi:hypothetical protein
MASDPLSPEELASQSPGGLPMPIVADWECRRGEALVIAVQVKDAAGLPVDITGWSLAFTLKREHGDLVALISKTTVSGITITDGPEGMFEVTVSRAQTLSLSEGFYVCDFFRTDSGAEASLTEGEVEVKPSVLG